MAKYIYHTFKSNTLQGNASSLFRAMLPPLQASENLIWYRKGTMTWNELIFSMKLKVIYLHKKFQTKPITIKKIIRLSQTNFLVGKINQK